jgi:hypothetical protein
LTEFPARFNAAHNHFFTPAGQSRAWVKRCLGIVMPADVLRLMPHERVLLDSSRIEVLYAQLGGEDVQALVERAMNELCVVRGELSAQYASGDLHGFSRNLRRLRRIGEHLGLPVIARVADDVAACLDAGNATALAATWARLMRTADQAIAGRWEDAS